MNVRLQTTYRLNGAGQVFQNVKLPLAALLQLQGCQHILQAGLWL